MYKFLRNSSTLRMFLLIDIISAFSIGMINVGANWYVLAQTKSNQLLSIYLVLNVVGTLLMTSLAGNLIDRFSRKKIITLSFLIRFMVFASVALWLMIHGFSFVGLCLVSIIFGVGWLFYYSASRSYLQGIVSNDDFGKVNSFLEITLQVGMFTSGGLTGIFLKYINYSTVLMIGAGLLLCVSFISLRLTPDAESNEKMQSMVQKKNSKFSEIIGFYKENKIALLVSILAIVPLFIIQIYNVSMPGYVLKTLNSNSVTYGFSDMLYGVGGMISGLIGAYVMRKFKFKSLVLGSYLIILLSFMNLVIYQGQIVLFICAFIIGLFNSATRIFTNTQLMLSVPNEYMGRVTSFISGLTQICNLILTLSIGTLNDRFGATSSFLIISFIILVIMLMLGFGPNKFSQESKQI